MCLVVAVDKLDELGLEPARSTSVAGRSAGCTPRTMGIGPVPAVRSSRATGLGWPTSTSIELNEAFAAQVLAVLREWGLPDEDRGSTCTAPASRSGHPIARPARASWPPSTVSRDEAA
jgi:acetyl-CoA C-acetyltransferase